MSEPVIVVRLAGPPRGKGRPRMRVITSRGGQSFASVYTDAETRNYEGMLRQEAVLAMRASPLLAGPLRVVIHALFPVPASWSRRKRGQALDGLLRPTGKPDFDNIGKLACDPLNGIVWNDDAQVVDARIIKSYADKPCLMISVWRETMELGLKLAASG